MSKRGGKKGRRGKKRRVTKKQTSYFTKRDHQVYGIVEKINGDYAQVKCSDGGRIRNAKIPGKFFKKVWLKPGDVLLCNVEIMGTSQKKCFIELYYEGEHVSRLKRDGELDFLNETAEHSEGNIVFDNDLATASSADLDDKMVEPCREIDYDEV